MISYSPIDGEVYSKKNIYRPKTCFLMTKIGNPIPNEIRKIRNKIQEILDELEFKYIDANSYITGKDFLLKIWQIILSVPIGIGIISSELNQFTMANIFYEVGLMQALGKETVIIKSKDIKIPSDLIRTEYIEFDDDIKENIQKYFSTLTETAEHFLQIGRIVENNVLLSLDYLKRSFLITGHQEPKDEAKSIASRNEVKEKIAGLNITSLIDFSWMNHAV